MELQSLSHIRYKRFLFFTVNDYFLAEDGRADAAINYFIQCQHNATAELREFYTLLVDLQPPEELIWQNIYHRTRSEISSFLTNQTFRHELLVNPSARQLAMFTRLFNRFARHKHIRKAESFRLNAYRQQQLLAISCIRQNDRLICINFYRLTRQRATNLYSFHLGHEPGSHYSASHYGRAHRALHWLDLQQFKKAGVMAYDFCGWYNGQTDKALLNINTFKEQFGGKKIKEYSGVIYNNPFLKFLKAWR